MQRLEVSCAVRHIYIFIYVVRRQTVKHSPFFLAFAKDVISKLFRNVGICVQNNVTLCPKTQECSSPPRQYSHHVSSYLLSNGIRPNQNNVRKSRSTNPFQIYGAS